MSELKNKSTFSWKLYRLKQFQKVIQTGKRLINFNFPQFSFYVAKNNLLLHCQFGISVPRKMIKKAVPRNFYKRQIKNMLIGWLQKQNYSCQTSNSHSHQSLIIIMRYPYLKNDFATNQKKLYHLLPWVLNQNQK
ncbi:MAG: ribonuclease P protein component [Candidatus Moeniiplasma glomeromycotorum]|nr:ribonuclease P protein component [Candidatus Moeniiplasma glomeromycotorum]MCE8167432.1 ribonuclease P protein component [Candidatus Moeniiplasma glomeromycotorum]